MEELRPLHAAALKVTERVLDISKVDLIDRGVLWKLVDLAPPVVEFS